MTVQEDQASQINARNAGIGIKVILDVGSISESGPSSMAKQLYKEKKKDMPIAPPMEKLSTRVSILMLSHRKGEMQVWEGCVNKVFELD